MGWNFGKTDNLVGYVVGCWQQFEMSGMRMIFMKKTELGKARNEGLSPHYWMVCSGQENRYCLDRHLQTVTTRKDESGHIERVRADLRRN